MRCTGYLSCLFILQFIICSSSMISPPSRVKNIFAPVLYIPKPIPGFHYPMKIYQDLRNDKVRRACMVNKDCMKAKGFRSNQLGLMLPMNRLQKIRMIPPLATRFPKYGKQGIYKNSNISPSKLERRLTLSIKRAKALKELEKIGSLSFSLHQKRQTTEEDLDDIMPMSYSYREKRGDADSEQDLDDIMPMSFSYRGKRGDADSEQDLDDIMPMSFSYRGKKGVALDNQVTEDDKDYLASLGSISFSQMGKRSGEGMDPDQLQDSDLLDYSGTEERDTKDDLADLDSMSFAHLGKRSPQDDLDDIGSMSFSQFGKRSSQQDDVDGLDSMSFSHPGKRSNYDIDDLDSMSFSQLGKRSNQDDLDGLDSMSFSHLGKRSDQDDLDGLDSMSYSHLGKRSDQDDLDDLGSMSFSQFGKRSKKGYNRALIKMMQRRGFLSLAKLKERIDSQYNYYKQRNQENSSDLKPQILKRNSVVGINQWG